jgi:hypothetical protein
MIFDWQGTTRNIQLRIDNNYPHGAATAVSEMENQTVRSVGSALAADPQRIEPNRVGFIVGLGWGSWRCSCVIS